jgi:hypothetical protein
LPEKRKTPETVKASEAKISLFQGSEEEGLCSGRIKESQSLRRRFIKL